MAYIRHTRYWKRPYGRGPAHMGSVHRDYALVRRMARIANNRIRRVKRGLGLSKRVPRLGRGKALFPDRLKCHLWLQQEGTLTSTTGSLATKTMNMNALWKPDPTNADQPRFFDTLFGPSNSNYAYSSYRVTGAKVILQMCSDAAYCSQFAMGMRDGNTITAPTSIKECDERTGYSVKLFGSNAGGPSVVSMSRYYDFAKIAGVSRSQYLTDDDYRGTYTTNPAELLNLDIFHQTVTANTRVVSYKLKIIFYVTCLYPNDVADS